MHWRTGEEEIGGALEDWGGGDWSCTGGLGRRRRCTGRTGEEEIERRCTGRTGEEEMGCTGRTGEESHWHTSAMASIGDGE